MTKIERVSQADEAQKLGQELGLNVTAFSQSLERDRTVIRIYVEDSLEVLLGSRAEKVLISNRFSRVDDDLPHWAQKLFAALSEAEWLIVWAQIGFSVSRGNFIDVIMEKMPLYGFKIEVVEPDPLPVPSFVSLYTLSVLRRLSLGGRLFARHQHQRMNWYMGRDEHDPYSDAIEGDKLKADLSKEVEVYWGTPDNMTEMFSRPVLKWVLIEAHNVYNGEDCVIDEYTLTDEGKQYVKERADG